MLDGPNGGLRPKGTQLTPKRQEFESLFHRHRARVFAFALRRVGAEEAKDVVADTFLVAWRRFDEIPPEPLPWLLGVTRKVITTRARSEQRVANLYARLREQPVARSSEASDERLHLARAFTSLSDKDQEILMLVSWDGLTIPQAAQVLRCSVTTFSVRLHRARRHLEQQMQADEREPFLPQQAIPSAEEAR